MKTISIPTTHINLAAFCPNTRVLGPGQRAAIWVQGCKLNCPECIAPDWIPIQNANILLVDDLVQTIISLPELDGLTISGGEPMLQAVALTSLVRQVRAVRAINVICFSGYTLEQMRHRPPAAGVLDFLGELDVLIDGPYRRDANNGLGLRGSTNQQIYYLTPALRDCRLDLSPRSTEIYLDEENMLVVGIPERKVQKILDQLAFFPMKA